MVADCALFLALWLLWKLSLFYNDVIRRLEGRERLRIAWRGTHGAEISVVAAEESPVGSGLLGPPPALGSPATRSPSVLSMGEEGEEEEEVAARLNGGELGAAHGRHMAQQQEQQQAAPGWLGWRPWHWGRALSPERRVSVMQGVVALRALRRRRCWFCCCWQASFCVWVQLSAAAGCCCCHQAYSE